MLQYTTKGAQKKRTIVAIVLLLCLLVYVSICGTLFQGAARFFVVSSGYAALFFIARFAHVRLIEIGLTRWSLLKSAQWSLIIGSSIIACLATAYVLLPALFQDSRYVQSLTDATRYILVYLPLRTVFFEELVFRGLLLGLLYRVVSMPVAISLSSLIFGLWHILPSVGVEVARVPFIGDIPSFVIIWSIVTATTAAGVLFCYFRIWTQNLLMPILIHWIINGTAVALAALAWR